MGEKARFFQHGILSSISLGYGNGATRVTVGSAPLCLNCTIFSSQKLDSLLLG